MGPEGIRWWEVDILYSWEVPAHEALPKLRGAQGKQEL